jgi:transposase
LELELQFGAQLIFSVCIQIQRFIIFIDYTNHFEQEADAVFSGKIEVGENYFGGKRKGNQGIGVAGKVLLFGPFERRDKVYTKVIANAVSILDNDLYLTPILD